MNALSRLVAVLAVAAASIACGDAKPAAGKKVLRVGRFPNVTHAQGLVAHGMTREGKGWFEERLGPDVTIEWYSYKAGPSAMEALLTGSLDLTYVGPSPALNAHVRSGGAEAFVIAGAARGGAALVVQGDGRIRTAADFRGRTIATPQLGNTQDVSCRAWLAQQGFRVTQTGGDVSVVPTANPDQLSLFLKGDLDAVWTVEPWVSRLVREGKGSVFLEEKDAVTTVLVASAKFLDGEPELAKRFAKAHAELTAWIVANPADAQKRVREAITAEMKKDMGPELVAECWARLKFDTAVTQGEFDDFVRGAQSAGFLKDAGDLTRFVRVPLMVTESENAKLSLDGVSKSFRTRRGEVDALSEVSLTVGEGEFVCLVGPSGCGKSTVLNLIAGLEFPDTGDVLADGSRVAGPGRDRMVMFQESALFPWLDVMGNVLFGLNLKPSLDAAARRDTAAFYLDMVGLAPYAKANIHELSGGMKQRVALARALAPNPRVLLMDEPFAALDALTREQLYGDLQRIWQQRKKTIVFVTHNVREAVCLGDRVIVFSPHPGRVREQFEITLPLRRDLNSVELARQAGEITKALKAHLGEGAA